MASGWVKSLHCKSRAFEDVYLPSPMSRLSTSASCRKSAQTVKDVVEMAKHKPKKPKPKPRSEPPSKRPSIDLDSDHAKNSQKGSDRNGPTRPRIVASTVAAPSRVSRTFYPALTDLPEGHPSRKVVEIIFHTSWSPRPFSGRVEKMFKVQNGPKTVARFEEYREVVKSRAASVWPGDVGEGASEDNVRCVADGNEVMRFHCMGPASAGGGVSADFLALSCGKGAAICTFAGSGPAHESAGGGKGRRAMLVCRVVAGRVVKQVGFNPFMEGRAGYDSVSGDKGELTVFDPCAVLPCFLIIYRL